MTLSEMMMELRDHPHGGNGVTPKRQPVCLLLGGGMAAGKSTVREIIGRDIFWSKVGMLAIRSRRDASQATMRNGQADKVRAGLRG